MKTLIPHGIPDSALLSEIEKSGALSFPLLKDLLTRDLEIEAIEAIEKTLKAILRKQLLGKVSGELARRLAVFHKDVGFILKYKSYSIKASTPLGYSIFLQNPGEGFSFQRHVTHKVEAFHIIHAYPGAFVFFCKYEDWHRIYDQKAFSMWLEGKSDERYDRFRFRPAPGDIFLIDQPGIVHTAIGCVVEEFANVSSDMVDRLHDQNYGKTVPLQFCRNYAIEHLLNLSYPNSNRLVDIYSYKTIGLSPRKTNHSLVVPIAGNGIRATHYNIEPKGGTEIRADKTFHTSIYVTKGSGNVIIGELNEVKRASPPVIEVGAGNVLFIPAGIYYGYVANDNTFLELSEHKVRTTNALI